MPELAAIIRADDAWPADPNEVPRWRLAQEERARRIGYELPPYRTRAEYEASVHAVTQRLALLSIPPADGARRFVAWCLEQQDASRFTSAELDAAYGRYCKLAGLIPHAPGPFRAALKKIAGVEVAHAEKDRNGRRHRPTIWTIRHQTSVTRMAA